MEKAEIIQKLLFSLVKISLSKFLISSLVKISHFEIGILFHQYQYSSVFH